MIRPFSHKQAAFAAALAIALLGGCDDERAAQLSREAANRQAEQNRRMAEVVKAETEANQEMARLQRDVQANQAEMDRQRSTLEAERREIAGERRRESFLAPAVENLGGLLVVVAVLVLCWYLLVGATHRDDTDQRVNELLVEELVSDQPVLAPPATSVAALEHQNPEVLPGEQIGNDG